MDQFTSMDKNLPGKSSQEKRHVNMFKPINPKDSDCSLDDMLNKTHSKLEIFHAIIYNSMLDNSTEDYFVHSPNKGQFLEIFNVVKDVLGTFLGTFTAHEILQLRREMGKYLHKFNLLALW